MTYYFSGSSDTFTNLNGDTVTYTTSSNETLNEYSTSAFPGLNRDESSYWIGDGNGAETHTHTFSQAVDGLVLDVYGLSNYNFYGTNEISRLTFYIDGVKVNLDTLIANGDVTITSTNGTLDVLSDGSLSSAYQDSNAAGTITFNIPVTSLTLVASSTINNPTKGNGSLYQLSTTDAIVPDYTVEGTAGDDLIDFAYTGDPDGDMVDANDAADGSNNDLIEAGDGNDIVYAGTGNDTIYDGDGNDIVYGDSGRETIYAGAGDDTFYGGNDADVVFFSDGWGNDTVYGGEADSGFDEVDFTAVTNDLSVIMTADETGTITDGTNTATVEGVEVLFLGSGSDTYDGTATTSFTYVFGEGGDDTLYGGSGDDELYGGFGNDYLVGNGGSNYFQGDDGNDTLVGGDAYDALYGGSGDDLIFGNGGDDYIWANIGADTIDGGAGNDYIELHAPGFSPPDGEPDVIVLQDGSGDDTLYQFDKPIDNGDGTWTGIDKFDVTALHDAAGSPVNVYDVTVTDTNGDGTGDAILNFPNGESVTMLGILASEVSDPLALNAMGIPLPDYTVSGTAGDDLIDFAYTGDPDGDMVDANDAADGSNNDLIEAGDGNDTVLAGAGSDTIYDGAGNDTVYGGDLRDYIYGGAGDDTFYGDDGGDRFYLGDGWGNDTIYGGEVDSAADEFNLTAVTTDLTVTMTADEAGTATDGTNTLTFEGIEGMILGSGNDYYDGTAWTSDSYVVAGAGDDTLLGSTGYDDLRGGDGNDLIIGGEGGGNLNGGAGNDSISGGDGVEDIYGGSGDDSIFAGGGDDWIWAGDGADTVEGGAGNDYIELQPSGFSGPDAFVDVIVLADGSGQDTLLHFGKPTDNGDGTWTGDDQFDVTGLHDANGSPVNVFDVTVTDTNGDGTGHAILTFPNGESVTMLGILASEVSDPLALNAMGIPLPDYTVSGTAGDDLINVLYTGDPEGDMVDANDAADGSNNDVIEAGAGNDRVYSSLGDDTVYGGDGNDYIMTASGNDVIYGGAGNDNHDSDFGDDTFYGEGGDDWVGLYRNFDGETLFGGETDETLGDMLDVYGQLYGDQSATTVVLTGDDSGTATVGGTETATFDGFERFILRSGDDVFDGTISTENLSVQGGFTGAGNNLFMTGSGNDTLDGRAGDDTLDGGAGDDTLLGGDGNDTLIGGTGNDTLTGGDGDDVFVYQPGDGADVITDFGVGNTGTVEDGDQQNNDFVDLSAFYNSTTLADVNANGGNFATELGMLRADAADGTLDGIIDGVDYSAQIGDINLTLENAGVAVTGTDLTFDNTNVVCFTSGTLIETDRGPVPIEDISVGDLVLTKDDGLQPIRWIGSRKVGEDVLCQNSNLRPIRIAAQSLGCGLPKRDLLVSPQHRMLIRSQIADRMFGESEVLVAAKHLTAFDGIEIAEDQPTVTYWHFMFDRHQVVFAEGAESESLYAGKEALSSIPIESLREIHTLFPEVSEGKVPSPARKLVKGRQGRRLAERHHTNRRPLFQSTLPKPSDRHEVRI